MNTNYCLNYQRKTTYDLAFHLILYNCSTLRCSPLCPSREVSFDHASLSSPWNLLCTTSTNEEVLFHCLGMYPLSVAAICNRKRFAIPGKANLELVITCRARTHDLISSLISLLCLIVGCNPYMIQDAISHYVYFLK